jgi:hypothetical protein
MRSKATDWTLVTGLLASLTLGAPGPARATADPEEGPAAPEAHAAEAPQGKLYWKDGVTAFETEDFRIALSNRVQFRFVDLFPDSGEKLAGTAAAGDSLPGFRVRRAKTSLEGWFWKKEFSYELQIGWAGSDSTGGSAVFSGLEDARLTWDVGGSGQFQVKIGQYKVPFGRQEITSSERQQFVDRSILSGEFTHSRDVGVSLEGVLAAGKLEYHAGAFNGNGRNKPTNDNAAFQYDARLVFQPWGDVKYSEGDFESKDRPLLALAAEFEQNDLSHSTNTNNFKNTIFGGDLVFKFKGLSLFGEYFWRTRAPEQGDSFRSDGYHVQAGYFLVRDRLELAFRYAAWDPSDQVSGDTQSEVGGAVNYYFLKHRFKIGGDFRQIEDQTRGTKDKELRLQTQFVF